VVQFEPHLALGLYRSFVRKGEAFPWNLLHFQRAAAERAPNRRSRWHSVAHSASCGLRRKGRKARVRGRHKGLPLSMPLFVSQHLCRPRSRAWVAPIPNPQLALWATLCRQLRWLSGGSSVNLSRRVSDKKCTVTHDAAGSWLKHNCRT
jgi:hypothetical protein